MIAINYYEIAKQKLKYLNYSENTVNVYLNGIQNQWHAKR